MTTQLLDLLEMRDRPHVITDVDGRGLFDPRALGITTSWLGSHCWRGFHCRYALADDPACQ